MPDMVAPIFTRKLATSTTSGSTEACLITVVPLERTAAMSRFSVPVWLG
jgi:hypothetical protein